MLFFSDFKDFVVSILILACHSEKDRLLWRENAQIRFSCIFDTVLQVFAISQNIYYPKYIFGQVSQLFM